MEHRINLSFFGNPDKPLEIQGAVEVEVEGIYYESQKQVADTLASIKSRLENLKLSGGYLLESTDLEEVETIIYNLEILDAKYQNDDVPVTGMFLEGYAVLTPEGEGMVVGIKGNTVVARVGNIIYDFKPTELTNVFEHPGIGYINALTLGKAQALADAGIFTFYPETEPGMHSDLIVQQKKA